MCVCVCVCVRARFLSLFVCVCVYARARVRIVCLFGAVYDVFGAAGVEADDPLHRWDPGVEGGVEEAPRHLRMRVDMRCSLLY